MVKVFNYLDDEEFSDFQMRLMLDPDVGDVIPGSGGLRKVRWGGKGKGKRGGVELFISVVG